MLFLASCGGAALSLLPPAASGTLCRSHLRCHTCGAGRAPAEEAPFSTPAGWKVPQPWARRPVETRKALSRGTKELQTAQHDTWTYDSSSPGLSFTVCQGQSSQCTHTHTHSTERVCQNGCKGHETAACCCTCRHDGILYYIIQYVTLHYILLCSFIFYSIILCYALFYSRCGNCWDAATCWRSCRVCVCVFTCVFLDIQSAPPAVKAAAVLQSSHSQLRLKVKRRGPLAYTTTRCLSEKGLESPTGGARVL